MTNIFQLLIVLFLISFVSCVSSVSSFEQLPLQPNYTNPFLEMMKQKKLKVIKAKLYHGDTILILWLDNNGDKKCDISILYEKSDDHYVENPMTCKQANDIDKHILEPRI